MTEQTNQATETSSTSSTTSTETTPETQPQTANTGTDDAAVAAAAAAEAAKAAETAKAGEQTPEQKAAAEAEAAKAGDAPIVYADFTIPDGAQINDEVMGTFKEFGATHKFSQEQMQGLLDLQGKLNQSMMDTHQDVVKGWRTASENDPEFGGAKFKESLTVIAKGRDSLASQKFVELMDTYGLSENPEVLRHFYKLGSRVSEDTTAAATGSSNGQETQPSRAEILYGKTTK